MRSLVCARLPAFSGLAANSISASLTSGRGRGENESGSVEETGEERDRPEPYSGVTASARRLKGCDCHFSWRFSVRSSLISTWQRTTTVSISHILVPPSYSPPSRTADHRSGHGLVDEPAREAFNSRLKTRRSAASDCNLITKDYGTEAYSAEAINRVRVRTYTRRVAGRHPMSLVVSGSGDGLTQDDADCRPQPGRAGAALPTVEHSFAGTRPSILARSR